jgi:hypothetical protein
LQQDKENAELMLHMLRQSLTWIFSAEVGEIVKRLDINNPEEKLDVFNVLTRSRAMYPSDVRFSRRQIDATAQFMRSAGILKDDNFDINTLIVTDIAGVKP